ncbi:MAG: FAD-binding oxidoreductase [Candidatus Nanopelagicales bacterium]
MTPSLSVTEGEQLLTGWGRTCPSLARVQPCASVEDVQTAIRQAGPRGALVRGLGRSYGDASQSGGGTVLDLRAMSGVAYDPLSGTVTAGAGASLDEIMRSIVPQGAFVPVTPGTRMITVGGAIGADVHGKNHHVDGTFGTHVQKMTLIDGNGEIRELAPSGETAAQFWATIGGMGLTGAVVEATFDVIPLTSSLISVDTQRVSNLDDVMARMAEGDSGYRYTVAWIDSVASSGRGIITSGDHAPVDQLSDKQRIKALAFDPKALATAPAIFPSGLLNNLTIRAFNEAWFRKAPRSRVGELQSIGAFFHPLDGIQNWNRIYGPRGFLQYQFVVPDSASHVIRIALDRLREVGAPSFLTVLKRFGPANPAPLSFPQAGWTLAADVPARIEGLGATLDELDELITDVGGRLYLAKDSRQSPQMFARTYPRLAEWQLVRDELDPRGVFTSDLARRLSI